MRWFLACVAGAAAAFTSTAAADRQYVAHPDPAGTQILRVAGEVESYALGGGRVTLVARERTGTCRRTRWTVGGAHESAPVRCGTAPVPHTVDRSGATEVELRPGAGERPDRLFVDSPAGERSWPLPERAFHVDVDGGIAIFSTRSSREVYAVELATGRTALVGLTRRRDTPVLSPDGLLFQDNVFKRLEGNGTTLMKFVPRAYVEAAARTVGRSLPVKGEVADLAMDGSRVALAVRNWNGDCDAVVYWNVAWRYAIPITEDEERTCTWSHRGASIQSVSIAGLRAAWVMRVGADDRLVSASSVDCFERQVVTARGGEGDRLVAHAGDSGLLAYLVVRRGGSVLAKLDGRMRGAPMVTDEFVASALAVDGDQVAVLRRDGTVLVRTKRGAASSAVTVGAARAIALRGHTLVALTADRLEVYDTSTRARTGSWPVPRGVRARVDLHFGVAVLSSPARVWAVSLETGRTAVVARTRGLALAAIEAPGITYADRGASASTARVSFVPFSRLERVLGLASS